MYTTLVHSDWSIRPEGRWVAEARFVSGSWQATGPACAPPSHRFVQDLVASAIEGPTLAGFDFPIGLPFGYGARTGLPGFGAALEAFGTGQWTDFFRVADTRHEIGLARPFYPRVPGGTSQAHLLSGHGVDHIAAITRACERGGNGLRKASCMFWTLGANQVGKAAIDGWQNVIVPARKHGAKLWPFDGDLDELAASGGLTLAETYPGDVYDQIGVSFKGKSKRKPEDRASLAPQLLDWTCARRIILSEALQRAIVTGFPRGFGEDNGFDAVLGLLALIGVVIGEQDAGAPDDDATRRWEGWILGRRTLST